MNTLNYQPAERFCTVPACVSLLGWISGLVQAGALRKMAADPVVVGRGPSSAARLVE